MAAVDPGFGNDGGARARASDGDVTGGRLYRIGFVLAAAGVLALNVGVGLFARSQQNSIRDYALRIYDHDFVSATYLNGAQLAFQQYRAARAQAQTPTEISAAQSQLGRVADDIDVAIERADSEPVAEQRQSARQAIAALDAGDRAASELGTELANDAMLLQRLTDRARAEGLRARDRVVEIAASNDWLLSASIATSAVLAGIILFLVRRSIANAAFARVNHLANHDSLTGLPNRAQFHARVKQLLKRSSEPGGGLSVLSLDLDRFKIVNDTLGHHIGDHLLVEVAERIKKSVRRTDIVARFGGDEFMILLPGASTPEDVGDLAATLVTQVSAPYFVDNQRISIGASVGIAFAPQDGETSEELIRSADQALYAAKNEGKGRYRMFTGAMKRNMQSRHLMELDLREALEQGKIDVYYQPLLNAPTSEVISFEALARWIHPTRGYVSPGDFIPLAEETGLILKLGESVLEQACVEAASWPGRIGVAVNLSVAQFRSGNLLDVVKAALAKSGLAPERLELEITESILIEEKREVLKSLTALRELGVRIALDDFGTGYSSLAYLSSFPFDKLKIDRSFVRDIQSRADSAAIVTAILSLADTLNISTTAEGVEKAEEFSWLRERGCDEVQGFLFSAAMPARELPVFVTLNRALRTLEPESAFQAA